MSYCIPIELSACWAVAWDVRLARSGPRRTSGFFLTYIAYHISYPYGGTLHFYMKDTNGHIQFATLALESSLYRGARRLRHNVFLSLPKQQNNALHANITLLTVSQILRSSASEWLVFFITSCGQLAVWERLSEDGMAANISWRKWSTPYSLSKHDPLTSTTKDYLTELSVQMTCQIVMGRKIIMTLLFHIKYVLRSMLNKAGRSMAIFAPVRCCLFHNCVGAPLKDVCDRKATRVWNTWLLESYPLDIRYIYGNDSDAPNENFLARA